MSALGGYVLRRLVQVVPIVLFILVLNFVLIRLAPGDIAVMLAGEEATDEYIADIRAKYGLDKSIPEQFIVYLKSLLRGDLGYSLGLHLPVVQLILQRLPATLLLMIPSRILAFALGVLLGVYSARKYRSGVGRCISAFAMIMYSMPIFWLGLLLLLLFGVRLQWFPLSGMMDVTASKTGLLFVVDVLWHMTIPALALILRNYPIFFNVTRASVVEVMEEDYVTTARATGFRERTVFFKYVLRNALLPTVTVLGVLMTQAFTGAILTEVVFGWPGMGRLAYEAISFRDYPLLQGIFLFGSFATVFLCLITDILYAVLDPRITYK